MILARSVAALIASGQSENFCDERALTGMSGFGMILSV